MIFGQNLALTAVASSSGGGVAPNGPDQMNDDLTEGPGIIIG